MEIQSFHAQHIVLYSIYTSNISRANTSYTFEKFKYHTSCLMFWQNHTLVDTLATTSNFANIDATSANFADKYMTCTLT